MKLPRDLSGHALAKLLRCQVGSHLRLESSLRGFKHSVTIPAHARLKVGTLSSILSEVAHYLEVERSQLQEDLFIK